MSKCEEAAARADRYFRQGFLEAAVDWWNEALNSSARNDLCVQIYDGLGKAAIKRERPVDALSWFDKALVIIPEADIETHTSVAMRRAVALSLAGQRDRAFREAHHLVRSPRFGALSPQRQGIILINFAGLEMGNELFEAAIESLTHAATVLAPYGRTPYDYALRTNLGISYLELRDPIRARLWFQRAILSGPANPIRAVNGLAHIAVLMGHDDEMQRWGHAAFTGIWDSLMSFETEELAYLSEVLGYMALNLGHGRLAVRLFDQSQGLYGRSGIWNRWRLLNPVIADAEALKKPGTINALAQEIERFTVLMEFMLAQDLIMPQASELADIRLLVADRLGNAMGMGDEQKRDLTYVCRLADVGLSAVTEPDESTGYVASPRLYNQHPSISVRLLDRLGLSEGILQGIQDHHERWDGQGFPDGKRGNDIALVGRIFAVVDRYARQTVISHAPHRVVIADIQEQSGTTFDPACVDNFVRVFEDVM